MKSAAEFYEQMEKTIAEHGRLILGVPSPEGGFSYTIGNTEAGLPELLMLGIDPRVAQSILNAVSEAIKAFPPGDGTLVDIGGACPVRLRALDGIEVALAREEYAIQAGRYYQREDLPIMLVEYPDPAGRFPDETDCDPAYILAQAMRVH